MFQPRLALVLLACFASVACRGRKDDGDCVKLVDRMTAVFIEGAREGR